jgi:hypothetical protein
MHPTPWPPAPMPLQVGISLNHNMVGGWGWVGAGAPPAALHRSAQAAAHWLRALPVSRIAGTAHLPQLCPAPSQICACAPSFDSKNSNAVYAQLYPTYFNKAKATLGLDFDAIKAMYAGLDFYGISVYSGLRWAAGGGAAGAGLYLPPACARPRPHRAVSHEMPRAQVRPPLHGPGAAAAVPQRGVHPHGRLAHRAVRQAGAPSAASCAP